MQTILHGESHRSASKAREKCALSRFFFSRVFCIPPIRLNALFAGGKIHPRG